MDASALPRGTIAPSFARTLGRIELSKVSATIASSTESVSVSALSFAPFMIPNSYRWLAAGKAEVARESASRPADIIFFLPILSETFPMRVLEITSTNAARENIRPIWVAEKFLSSR
jgi:hypothetical protein